MCLNSHQLVLHTGCLLTIWGLVAIVWGEVAHSAGVVWVAMVWSGYYIFTSIIEQSENTTRNDKTD